MARTGPAPWAPLHAAAERRRFARLLTFSDGLFAIAGYEAAPPTLRYLPGG